MGSSIDDRSSALPFAGGFKQSASSDTGSSVGKLLTLVTHELRKPLTPALLLVSYLESREGLPEELREDAQLIRQSIEQQARLIEELADLGGICTGKLKLQVARQDVHALLRSVVDDVGTVDAKRTVLDLEAADSVALIEPTRLRQAIQTVLTHAWHCSGSGGHVHVRTKNSSNRLTITVAHDGNGYDSSRLARLFDPFDFSHRLQPSTGLGLDLVLARGFVQAMGGELAVISDGAECGATFTFDFSLATPIG